MIKINFWGDGKGESILLRLPDGQYGVVDCYASSPYDISSNHICMFLEEFNIRKLLFLCWTHPHNDHSRGMLTLLKKYAGNIGYFWKFGGTSFQHLYAYYRSSKECCENQDFTRDNGYLISIFTFLNENRRSFKQIRLVTAHKELYRDNTHALVIEGIAPIDGIIEEYNSYLGKVFAGTLKEDLFKTQRHNMISAALLIKYGDARILLAGDTENKTWKILFNEECYSLGKHACQIVKVPHHGSKNAFYEDYWREWTENTETSAVITSLLSHKLPSPEIANRIKSYASAVYILGESQVKSISNRGFRQKNLINRGLNLLGAEFPSRTERVELSITQNGNLAHLRCGLE